MLENCNDLGDCESILFPRIGEISLLGQIVLSDEDIQKLGKLISFWMAIDASKGTKFLLKKFPACLSCFLVWVGIRYYEAGDYWSSVHQIAKLPEEPNWRARWGQTFLEYLCGAGLPTFADVGGHRYVTPILAHGGIPDYCLKDFFQNLLLPIVSGRLNVDITDAEEILQEWQEHSSLFMFTDKPVRRFLLYGGKTAADFLSRCIEMAQRAYEEEEVPEVEEIDIPPRIVQQFEQWWQLRRDKPHKRQVESSFRRPIILLAPEFGEVYLHVPQQTIEENAEGTAFHVEIIAGREEAFQQTLHCYKRDGLIETEEAQIRLPSPAEMYEVRLLSGSTTLRAWSFKGLTKERPWMAFEKATKRMIQSEELPSSSVWLVFPKHCSIEAVVSILEEGQSLYGRWAKYRPCLVDVTSVKDIRLLDESGAEFIIRVASETSSEPELAGGELLPLVFCEGEPVYSTIPTLLIPSAVQLPRWHLSIVPQGKTTVDTRKEYNLADITACQRDGTVVEVLLSELLGVHATGQFLIRLRGPLGKDRRFRLALLPGIKIKFDKQLYVPTLEKAPEAELTMVVESADHVIVEQPCHLIDQRESVWIVKVPGTESKVRCTVCIPCPGGESIDIPLVIRIPRLGLEVQGLKEQCTWQWSHVAREISLEQWEECEEISLLLDIPGVESGHTIIVLQDTNQEVRQPIRRGKTRFELKRFTDTLKVLGQPLSRFNLSLEANGTSFQDIPVLSVRTQWVVEGLNIDQEVKGGQRVIQLTWRDRGRVRNRIVRLWNLCRPWTLPLQSNIPDGNTDILMECPVVDLPPGKYRIEFTIEDPWIGASPVGLAPRSDSNRVFEFWVGDDRECSAYQNQLSETFQSSLERLAFQHFAGIGNLEQEITRIPLTEPLADVDLEAMVGLLILWLRDSKLQAHHSETLWRYVFGGHNQRLRDSSFAARFLLACGRFTINRKETVKKRAKWLCLLVGLTQASLRGMDRKVDESERNAVWELWLVLGLSLDLTDPDLNEPECLVRRLIRVLGEQPLKDILDWPKAEDFEWPLGCPADFAECLLCRLGLAHQCDRWTELNYSLDYYGGKEAKDLDLLMAKEKVDLQQILGSLQLYPVGLLHADAHLNAVANWVLRMKDEDRYTTLYKWVQAHLTQCKTALGEIVKQERLQPLVHALCKRLASDKQNVVCNVPFLVGSIALIQCLMAWGLYHTSESEKWKQLGIKAYQVAPELYERDLCLFDLSLCVIIRQNQVAGSVAP